MNDNVSNNNGASVQPGAAREPDGHGQAALRLTESLIHVLVERSVISISDAVDAVATATEVKKVVGPELGDTPATLARSPALLAGIRASLKLDLPRSNTADLAARQ